MGDALKLAAPWKPALLCALLFFCIAIPAYAASVTLKWDANTEPELNHYVVCWGTSSGIYPNSVNVPKDTNTHKVTGLAANTKYYFVVRAVAEIDGEEVESINSREVAWIKHDHTDDEGRDTEWEITSGDLKGFKFVFDSSTGIVPTLSSTDGMPNLKLLGVTPVGEPLKFEPKGIGFNPPVKIFLPCPDYPDVSSLDIYYYEDGTGWVLANDADDPYSVQPGAVNWMVEGSRKNHNFAENPTNNPSTMEFEVYGFSGAQAGIFTLSDSGIGRCFVATAAFGSEMDWHVKFLSEFRDKRLLTNKFGRRFVDLYYKVSPSVAHYLRKHPTARAAVRYALIPVTGVAFLALHIHPLVLLASFICFIFLANLCFRRLRRARQRA